MDHSLPSFPATMVMSSAAATLPDQVHTQGVDFSGSASGAHQHHHPHHHHSEYNGVNAILDSLKLALH